jgi:ABC-type sulfate transport system substrate-binding protein
MRAPCSDVPIRWYDETELVPYLSGEHVFTVVIVERRLIADFVIVVQYLDGRGNEGTTRFFLSATGTEGAKTLKIDNEFGVQDPDVLADETRRPT